MKRLIVYLNAERVGTLDQDDSGLLIFLYEEAWLGRADATPLSRALPLQGEPFRGKYARAFFAGILPDEEPRRQIASVLGISERNDFAMLERIGGECAGAVSLLPEDAPPPAAHDDRVRELSDAELADVVAELPHRPLLAGREGVRLSLAGSQDKLPVVVHGEAIALPVGATQSTHILKPEPKRFPGLVTVETFCMTLARSAGLDAPTTTVRLVGDTPCILVERYDRRTASDGRVERIHQEDFCQAMGYPPERKYQQEGGPLVRDCVEMLREWSTAPVLDVRDFVDALIFNMVIGNADAHGKNYSLLYVGGGRRLAPLYDLVSTLVWPELSKVPAMKIGASESIETIASAHWKKTSTEARLGWPMVRERIAGLCRRTIEALSNADLRSASIDRATGDRVSTIVESRAGSLFDAVQAG
jgi:serine/threonine-protein kinase HipA